ncbi:MAG: hypothetical protein ACOC46_00125 [Pirellulales bacterium]
MNDHALARAISATLDSIALGDADELAELELPEQLADVDATRSYAEAGVLTSDAGFVLRMADGSEYQVTVKQSRFAD